MITQRGKPAAIIIPLDAAPGKIHRGSVESPDESIANLADDIATNNHLRGSDAVHAAVALRYGTELITLDREQLEKLPNVLVVRVPCPMHQSD